MKISLHFCGLLVLASTASVIAACSTKVTGELPSVLFDDANANPVNDASLQTDAGASLDGAASGPAPAFLPASSYADWFSIDAAFPYDVTQVHGTDRALEGTSWGSHGGPLSNALSGNQPQALRYADETKQAASCINGPRRHQAFSAYALLATATLAIGAIFRRRSRRER